MTQVMMKEEALSFNAVPTEQKYQKKYELQDLSVTTQKEVKSLIYNLKTQNAEIVERSFDYIKDEMSRRLVHVMFEPLLNCDPLTDHKVPKSLLPIYIDYINKALEDLHNAQSELIQDQIIQAFGRSYAEEIDVKYKLQQRIDELEIELYHFQNQSTIQAQIIQQLQSNISTEKQKFIREMQMVREQISQRKTKGNQYEPDFNEVPQIQDVLQLPAINLDQIRSKSAKDFKSETSKLHAELRILKQQVAQQIQQLKQIPGLEAQLKAAQKDLEDSRVLAVSQQEDLRKQLNAAEAQLTQFKEESAALAAQLAEERQKAEEREFQVSELRSKLTEVEEAAKDYDQIKSEATRLAIKMEKANKLAEQQSHEITQLTNKLNKLTEDQTCANQDVETLTAENNELREQNEQFQARIAELEEQAKQPENNDKNLLKPPSKVAARKKQKDESVQVPDSHPPSAGLGLPGIRFPPTRRTPQKNLAPGSDKSGSEAQEFRKQVVSKGKNLGFTVSLEEVDETLQKLYEQSELLRTARKTVYARTKAQEEHLRNIWQQLVVLGAIRDHKNIYDLAVENIRRKRSLQKQVSIPKSDKLVQFVEDAMHDTGEDRQIIEDFDRQLEEQMKQMTSSQQAAVRDIKQDMTPVDQLQLKKHMDLINPMPPVSETKAETQDTPRRDQQTSKPSQITKPGAKPTQPVKQPSNTQLKPTKQPSTGKLQPTKPGQGSNASLKGQSSTQQSSQQEQQSSNANQSYNQISSSPQQEEDSQTDEYKQKEQKIAQLHQTPQDQSFDQPQQGKYQEIQEQIAQGAQENQEMVQETYGENKMQAFQQIQQVHGSQNQIQIQHEQESSIIKQPPQQQTQQKQQQQQQPVQSQDNQQGQQSSSSQQQQEYQQQQQQQKSRQPHQPAQDQAYSQATIEKEITSGNQISLEEQLQNPALGDYQTIGQVQAVGGKNSLEVVTSRESSAVQRAGTVAAPPQENSSARPSTSRGGLQEVGRGPAIVVTAEGTAVTPEQRAGSVGVGTLSGTKERLSGVGRRPHGVGVVEDLGEVGAELGDIPETAGSSDEELLGAADRRIIVEIHPAQILEAHREHEINADLGQQIRTVASHLSFHQPAQEEQSDEELLEEIFQQNSQQEKSSSHLNNNSQDGVDEKGSGIQGSGTGVGTTPGVEVVPGSGAIAGVASGESGIVEGAAGTSGGRKTPADSLKALKDTKANSMVRLINKIQKIPLNRQQQEELDKQLQDEIDKKIERRREMIRKYREEQRAGVSDTPGAAGTTADADSDYATQIAKHELIDNAVKNQLLDQLMLNDEDDVLIEQLMLAKHDARKLDEVYSRNRKPKGESADLGAVKGPAGAQTVQGTKDAQGAVHVGQNSQAASPGTQNTSLGREMRPLTSPEDGTPAAGALAARNAKQTIVEQYQDLQQQEKQMLDAVFNRQFQETLLQITGLPEDAGDQDTVLVSQKHARALSDFLYNPLVLRHVVNTIPSLQMQYQNKINQLYQPSFQKQLLQQRINKSAGTLIASIFYDDKMLNILTSSPIQVKSYSKDEAVNKNIDKIRAIVLEKPLKDDQPFNAVIFGQNIQRCIIDNRHSKDREQLQKKVSSFYGSQLYDKLVDNAKLDTQSSTQLNQLVKDPQLMQILISSDHVSKGLSKKLYRLYSKDVITQIESNQIRPEVQTLIADVLIDPFITKQIFGNGTSVQQQLINRRRNQLQGAKQLSYIKQVLLSPDTARLMAGGTITRPIAASIYKTFYNRAFAEKVAQGRFSTTSATRISNVLYNPEFANLLRRPELMDRDVVKMFAQTIYNDEMARVLLSQIPTSLQDQQNAKACIEIVKNSIANNVFREAHTQPFRVQIIGRKQLLTNPKRNTHFVAQQDGFSSFVARIPGNYGDNKVDLDQARIMAADQQRQYVYQNSYMDRPSPSVIKTFEIPDRTYDYLVRRSAKSKVSYSASGSRSISRDVSARRRINEIRHQAQPRKDGVPCHVVKLVSQSGRREKPVVSQADRLDSGRSGSNKKSE